MRVVCVTLMRETLMRDSSDRPPSPLGDEGVGGT